MPVATSAPPKVGLPPLRKPVDPSSRKLLYRMTTTPRTVLSSKGIYMTMDDGNMVIDGMSGAAVASIGPGVQEIIEAIAEQIKNTNFVYGQFYTTQAAEDLSAYMIEQSKGAFVACNFLTGGSEANESALKTARQYWWDRNMPERRRFIGREMSYHGNTIATLSVGHHVIKRAPFASFVNEDVFHYVAPANYLDYGKEGESEEDYATRLAEDFEAKILELGPETVAGFMAEPMSGSAMCCALTPKTYWPKIKAVCDKYDVLLLLDEVITGMGRTGTLWAFETLLEGVKPDILTCAKGLGAGYVPIGAMFVSEKVLKPIREGSGFWNHGFTYTGFPASCAGALAVQKYVAKHDLLSRVKPLGERLSSKLREGLTGPDAPCPDFVRDIRGVGLFWAVEVQYPNQVSYKPRLAQRLQAKALELGLMVLGMSGLKAIEGDAMVVAPAYITTESEIDEIARIIIATIVAVHEELATETLSASALP